MSDAHVGIAQRGNTVDDVKKSCGANVQERSWTGMRRNCCSLHHARSFVAVLALAGFVWSIALAASPQLHARIHWHAKNPEHTCAATFIASGNYHHFASTPLAVSAACGFVGTVVPFTPRRA